MAKRRKKKVQTGGIGSVRTSEHVSPKADDERATPSGGTTPTEASSPSPSVSSLSGVYASAVAFISGMCLMVLEVSSSRVLAPEFGNTVYLWSAIIGMILAALSAGYRLGGWWAQGEGDRNTRLMGLCGGTAATIAIIPAASGPLLEALAPSMSAEGGAMLATLLLFFVPSVLIGAMSPLAVKVLTTAGVDPGAASGRISALGALGSILGTFAAGFVLLPNFGTRTIFITLAVVMAVVGAVGALLNQNDRRAGAVALGAGGFALALAPVDLRAEPTQDVLFEHEGFYHRIRVLEYPTARGRVRLLELDSTNEGALALDGGFMPFWYTEFVHLAPVLLTEPKRAAFVGGGAFAMPRRFSDMFPSAEIDVYELDPMVVEVGKKFFQLEGRQRIHAVTGDARRALARSTARYDYIFGDAYNGVQWVPFHLTTREYYEIVRDHLTEDGVYMANIISSLDPEEGGFFYATLATLKEVFGHVRVFARTSSMRSSQNLVLLATGQPLRPDAELHSLARALGYGHLSRQLLPPSVYSAHLGSQAVLTDDYAPVEALIGRPFEVGPR